LKGRGFYVCRRPLDSGETDYLYQKGRGWLVGEWPLRCKAASRPMLDVQSKRLGDPRPCLTRWMTCRRSPRRGGGRATRHFPGVLMAHGRKTVAVFNPSNNPAVSDTGSLGSTGRQWHMTASLETVPKDRLPRASAPPAHWRRFWMVWKLTQAFASVGSRQSFSDAAYDLAFRIMATEKTLSHKRGGRGARTTS
jgi:hypothetical protein